MTAWELLEDRTLLAVTASVSGGTVSLVGSASDDLYLQTAPSGLLEFHDDTTTTYSTNLGGSTLNLTAQATTIDVTAGGTLHLDGINTAGRSLTIQGPTPNDSTKPEATVSIEANLTTGGGALTIQQFAGINVGSASANVAVSTRDVAAGASLTTGASAGPSGAMDLEVTNPDPFDPLPSFASNYPQITVAAGSSVLAQATNGYAPGSVILEADNTNYTLDGLSFPTLDAEQRSTAITLAGGTANSPAVVEGGTVDIESDTNDVPIVASVAANADNSFTDHTDNEFASWGQWVGGAINSLGPLLSSLPALNLTTLPVSLNYRDAAATVTIGDDAQVIGSGTVFIDSSTVADAEGQAIYSHNTSAGLAVALMMGTTDSVTDVQDGSLVESTGGGVLIHSDASSTASGIARVGQNVEEDSGGDNGSLGLALSVGVVNQTSHATVEQGAKVVAAGAVDLESNGSSSNVQQPYSTTYVDGNVGLSAAINFTENDIQANADGTIISGGSSSDVGDSGLDFNPYLDVDFANSAIKLMPSQATGLQTGQSFVYDSDGGGNIDGLTSGTTYYVIVPQGLTDEVQLADSPGDALAGKFIPFGAYPTIKAGSTTLPITNIDETSGTIEFGFDPGIADGQAVTYNALAGRAIGGLTGGTTYYAIRSAASPDVLQLSAKPPSGGVDGPAIPLNLNPSFTGFRQSIPITVDAQGDLVNSIRFAFNSGFVLGDHFVYQGSGISGLSDGVTYYVIPDASDPNAFQLADSYADAQAGTALPIGSGATKLTFDPAVSLDTTANTVDLGFNYALAGTLPNGTSLVYHAALGTAISGLIDGTTYYVIQDPANPRVMRLASTSATDAVAAYQAGQAAYNADYQAAYNTAYAAWLANHPGDTSGAQTAGNTAANSAASSFGADWTAAGIDGARVGAAPPVGTFPVTVNSTESSPANSIDFGFDAGFERNEPLVYEGASPAIIGLTPGTVYYVRLPAREAFPGLIQLADASGNIIPLGNAAGTTATIQFGGLSFGGVSVASNQITFLNPVVNAGDTPTIFDPGLNQGDPFVYEGPVSPPGDAGINGLTSGTTYYVIATSTPGVIELAGTPQDAANGVALPISLASSSTNINYAGPFTPADGRPAVVVSFGSTDPAVMTGASQSFDPVDLDGVTVLAALSASEEDYAGSAIGEDPKWTDKLSKPEVAAPTINKYFSSVFSSDLEPSETSAAGEIAKAPGGTGTSPSTSFVGTFIVQIDFNDVHADVAGTAKLESASDVSVSSSLSQSTNTADTGSISPKTDTDPTTGKKTSEDKDAGALVITFGYSDPRVLATVDDGAVIDAAGTVSVDASTVYPLVVPVNPTDAAGDLVYSASNPSFNPLNAVVGLLTDPQLGLGDDFLNNESYTTVKASGEGSIAVGGSVQVFIDTNDTEATIGDALINQDASDPNALGTGDAILFQNPAQSVSVDAETQYENLADTGKFDIDLNPVDLIKNLRTHGVVKGAGNAITPYDDTSGDDAFGASIFVTVLDNTTIAQVATGAKLGVGPAGSFDVDADQQILAVSLTQSGDAGGNIGFAGSLSWFNLTSTTRAQVEYGVTVDAGVDSQGNPLPAGSADVEADDNSIIVGVTGGAVKSNHIGVGFSAAVNNIDRTTLAVIGGATSQGTPTAGSTIDAGMVRVNATNDGLILGVSYAGAQVSSSEGQAAPRPPTRSTACLCPPSSATPTPRRRPTGSPPRATPRSTSSTTTPRLTSTIRGPSRPSARRRSRSRP